MICQNCNEKINDDVKFCPKCGADVANDDIRKISLICSSCGGTLSVDENSSVLLCPFCGAKELLLESETVEIEKIRNAAQKEIEIERIKSAERIKLKTEQQKLSFEEQKEIEKFKKGKLSKFLIIGLAASLLFAFIFFFNSYMVAGVISIVQALCFALAWMMGMHILKDRSRHLHTILSIIGVLLFIPAFISYGSNMLYVADTDWNVIFLKDEIPQPSSRKLSIHRNSDEELWIDVYNTSKEDYYKYVSACKTMGYDNEAYESSGSYSAYTDDGCYIELSHYNSSKEMTLRVELPVELSELNWDNHSIGKVLPEPPSTLGMFKLESKDRTSVIIGNISKQQYLDYCSSCRELGFTIEESGFESTYAAYGPEGHKIDVIYTVGNRQMNVTLIYPFEFVDITWPSMGIATLLPVPDSLNAKVVSDYDWSYSVYINNMSHSDFDRYVQKCVDSGFNKDSSKYENTFWADNADGESVNVSYHGNNVVYITIMGSSDKDYLS